MHPLTTVCPCIPFLSFQDTLKRNRIIHEEIREIEEWIIEKERDISIDDGAIFYQEQLRERLEQYQVIILSFPSND